jgi:hypothetical protein
VGGGPVGLTLGMYLAQRGVRTVVAEMHHKGEPPSVKCNNVSARSMEIFRRLGGAKAVCEAGLPANYPNDVSYRVSFTGKELSRIPSLATASVIQRAWVRIPGGRRPSPRNGSIESILSPHSLRMRKLCSASPCSIVSRSSGSSRMKAV